MAANPKPYKKSGFTDFRKGCKMLFYVRPLRVLSLFATDIFSRMVISNFNNFYPSLKH